MENNEICLLMDVKLNNHDKRPDSVRYKAWTTCNVKVEAIKCLPSFLRFTFTPETTNSKEEHHKNNNNKSTQNKPHSATGGVCTTEDHTRTASQKSLKVSVIVPGVTISLAASRTKQHSYGLFWTQNRRDCFIYFALESEAVCRRHMKWIKRAIKHLEVHRQIVLEQRRSSLVAGRCGESNNSPLKRAATASAVLSPTADKTSKGFPLGEGGPCPLASFQEPIDNSWSHRISHGSDIYEEIFDGTETPPRLSRRMSRQSIASGIYEEMKCTTHNFRVIMEEAPEPPPLPPMHGQRKRINTFELDCGLSEGGGGSGDGVYLEGGVGLLGEIPRSNTNPESELAKKKKFKNMLDNIFGSARSKRTKSVSEGQSSGNEEMAGGSAGGVTPPSRKGHKQEELEMAQGSEINVDEAPQYANEAVWLTARKRQRKPPLAKAKLVAGWMADAKRNSFSSPDLSKINFLDTFNEDYINEMLANPNCSSTNGFTLDVSSHSLDESAIALSHQFVKPAAPTQTTLAVAAHEQKPLIMGSAESLNISEQIPHNFNFSACNTSAINLVGSHGASRLPAKKQIVVEDLSGYCFMAPIKPKPAGEKTKGASKPQSLSSGYSTGSYSSTSSSCTNSTEDQLSQPRAAAQVAQAALVLPAGASAATTTTTAEADESTVYVNMHNPTAIGGRDPLGVVELRTTKSGQLPATPPTIHDDFSGNLYENLLTMKAAQELEHLPIGLSTSTPTESPQLLAVTRHDLPPVTPTTPQTQAAQSLTTEEDYYQTPRKSIISVDEKVPSYYPNSCETVKARRSSQSSSTSAGHAMSAEKTSPPLMHTSSTTLRRFGGLNKRYSITALEQQQNSNLSTSSTSSGSNETNAAAATTTTSKKPPKATNKMTGAAAAAAHRISKNIYSVVHSSSGRDGVTNRKSIKSSKTNTENEPIFNEELKDKLQRELLQMALLQNIDFKFDDTQENTAPREAQERDTTTGRLVMPADGLTKMASDSESILRVSSNAGSIGKTTMAAAKTTTPNTGRAASLIERYVNLSPRHLMNTPPSQHHLQQNQDTNTKPSPQTTPTLNGSSPSGCGAAGMTQSKLEVPVTGQVGGPGVYMQCSNAAVKKFASLPRFKKIDFSPIRLKINNVLQRNNQTSNNNQS